MLDYVKPTVLSLKLHRDFNEKWVQQRIAEDPSLLGLGDLVLKDQERIQPGAGRLDLLLQDSDASHRFEVELQLGKTDETHIIRTIEYWDIERKRYPQYEHTAVLVAEDITSRFLNVTSLFNGFIPLVAIQMNAVQIGNQVSLMFTKVLDQMRLGLVDEDEEGAETVDRDYWEKKGGKISLGGADQLLRVIQEIDPRQEFKYNKFYIGLSKDGQANTTVIFRPKKSGLRFEPRLEKSDEFQTKLEDEGLDLMDYDTRWGRYRIRLTPEDLKKHEALLREIIQKAFEEAGK